MPLLPLPSSSPMDLMPASSPAPEVMTMSAAMQRIEETREALVGALERRDWSAIAQLDLACRDCVDALTQVSDIKAHEGELRNSLEKLLFVYKTVIDAATGERQALFEEVMQIRQANSAAKVYHLFG
jgi:flagellar protein FliT